jgi:lysyl-tRNA synthetase class 2
VATEAELLEARRRRARQLRERKVELYPARVPRPLQRIPDVVAAHGGKDGAVLEQEASEVTVAGRLMTVRSFGRAAFATLQADGVRLQIWVKRDQVGEERYGEFKLYETGDFLWARGPLIRTKKGELSVDVGELGFLSKAYRPLPDKWAGLHDVETRYRQRYLDLLVNPQSRELVVMRSRIVATLRNLLDERGFLEVETPILQPVYGGAHARPFTTTHHAYGQHLYLRISFELYLKRLIIGGLDRVYEMGRDFRNEGVSKKHNPEFSMLEIYQAYADYSDMMELMEHLVAETAGQVLGGTRVEREGKAIDLAPPWPRRSMTELIEEHTGVNIELAADLESLRAAVGEADVQGIDAIATTSWALLVDALFSLAVEPKLFSPCFVVDYPVDLSPLAKKSAENPQLVERFEAFIGGMEISNAFSELNDPDDQLERFQAQAEASRLGDEEAHPIDDEFLRALEYGMPPTGGMGMGIGRLTMILSGASHLREVKIFPHLRPRDE